MKVELRFLNNFNCAYSTSLPMYADELETQIGTCKMTVENNKYIGDLYFERSTDIHDDFYLWCKWHISENELLTVDKIYLTQQVIDNNLAVQLKEAVLSQN